MRAIGIVDGNAGLIASGFGPEIKPFDIGVFGALFPKGRPGTPRIFHRLIRRHFCQHDKRAQTKADRGNTNKKGRNKNAIAAIIGGGLIFLIGTRHA